MDKFVVNFSEYNSLKQNESVDQNYMNFKSFTKTKYELDTNENKKCACYIDNDYPVDIESEIDPQLRTSDANTGFPNLPANGGLFHGPESNAYYMPAKIPLSTTLDH